MQDDETIVSVFTVKWDMSMDFDVAAGPGGGLLVIQRSHLSLWEAEIDGRPAKTVPVNLYRLAVEVPEGRHRVRFHIDRRPLVRSVWAAVFGLALLPVLAWWLDRRRNRRIVNAVT